MTSTEKIMVIMKSIAGMLGLNLVFMGVWALMDRFGLFNRTGAIIWAIALTISMLLACVALGWVGWHVLGERVYRQARAGGLPAQARVLEVQMTGVRRRLRHRLMPEREHILRVVVAPLAAQEYEARVVQFLDPKYAPRTGAVIAVKVHPRRPEIVVWDGETGEG
jgi:hypothetical protein